MFLRLALFAGHPVVLVGACRTGKTLLLDKLTSGKIIDKRNDAMQGKLLTISESEVPDGVYSLDECQLFEKHSIKQLMDAMAIQKRVFCLATQNFSCVGEAIDAYRTNKTAKRVLLVLVGGQVNPETILRELPQ